MPMVICGNCGCDRFRRENDNEPIDAYGLDPKRESIRPETILRCDHCGQVTTGDMAWYVAGNCHSVATTENLPVSVLKVLTLFLKRVMRLVHLRDSRGGRAPMDDEFRKMCLMFGHERTGVAMQALLTICRNVLFDRDVHKDIRLRLPPCDGSHPKNLALHDFLVEALQDVRIEMVHTYHEIVLEYARLGWDQDLTKPEAKA